MEKDVVVCARCEEYIGDLGDLDVCPVCGNALIGDNFEEQKIILKEIAFFQFFKLINSLFNFNELQQKIVVTPLFAVIDKRTFRVLYLIYSLKIEVCLFLQNDL